MISKSNYMVRYDMVWHGGICGMVCYGMVQYGMVWDTKYLLLIVQYGIVWAWDGMGWYTMGMIWLVWCVTAWYGMVWDTW